MSRKRSPSELLGDPGVLWDDEALELFGWQAVLLNGGLSVLPDKRSWKAALAAGAEAVSRSENVEVVAWQQAVIHLQKGRAATEDALAQAWNRLDVGGRLLLVGGNDLGVKSAVKRLAENLEQEPVIVANRARSRVAAFLRTDRAGPERPGPVRLSVGCGNDRFEVESVAGAFSGDEIDPGTQVVLDHLERLDAPRKVLDMGCGVGVLGIAALRRWEGAEAVLADVDRRALDAADRNLEFLDLQNRCVVAWWDAATEPPPVDHCDLVLINPPFHTGKAVDLDPARAMFRAVDQILRRGGLALVVANRTLPYERQLREIGRLSVVAQRHGFKLLEIRR